MEPTIFVRCFARIEVADVEKNYRQMALSGDRVYRAVRSRIPTWFESNLLRGAVSISSVETQKISTCNQKSVGRNI